MAKARRNDKVRLLGVARRTRPALMMSTALQATALLVLAMPAKAQPLPNARPTGGVVAAGTARIDQTSNTNTRIDQSTPRAAIDWRSFDVGSKQSVTFNQPSVSSVTLNRVTGPDPSQIAGRIDANGQIVLVNQSGVTFYKGAQVNAAGVMVSAANISNANFMAGSMKFDQAGSPNAKIDNQGSITIKEAGLAALVAPQVANSGRITAKLGHVVLAGAETATLDLYGDGLLSVNVTKQVTQAPIGKDGKAVTALVTNTGVIIADGGTVELTARAADGIVQNLVQAGGTIRAATLGEKTGTIALNGVGGSITVEGQLSAPGIAPGTTGGNIAVVSTGNVLLTSTAKINASGKAGGGVVALGTTLDRAKGGPAVKATAIAKNVVVEQGATVAANAIVKGTGGNVTLLAKNVTAMLGNIAAKGGGKGGNGGFVEVSGGTLLLTGHVDATAPLGATGTLLLDPLDLWVSDVEPGVAAFKIKAGDLPTVLANQAPDAATVSWVDPALLVAQGANITLAATRDLFVASSDGKGVTNSLNLGLNLLALSAGRDLTIDRGFTITASGYSLTAATGAVTLNGSAGVTGGIITAPQLALLSPTSIQAANATTTAALSGATGIALADAVIGSGATPMLALDLSTGAGGALSQANAGVINALTLQSSAGVQGAVTLLGNANNIAILGNSAAVPFGAAGQSFTLVDGGATALQVAGVTADAVALTAPGIGISGAIVGTSSVSLVTTSPTTGIILETGSIITPLLTGKATGDVTLTGTNNIAALGTSGVLPFDATGQKFELRDESSASLAVQGVTAATVKLTAPTISIPGTIVGTTSTELIATTGGISETGIIITSKLIGSAADAVDLTGTNNITTLGAFNAVGQKFNLVDNSSPSLAVSGPLSADLISLTAPSISIPGSVAGTTSVSVTALSGAITETGSITTPLLTGSAGTSASFTGTVPTTNQIDKLGKFDTTTSFTLNDGVSLAIVGAVTAGAGQTIALRADNLTIGAAVSAPGGTVAIAPATPTRGVSLDVANNPATLSLLQTDLNNIGTGTLALGSVDGGTTLLTSALDIATPINLTGIAGTLGLFAGGTITEPGGLTVATLTGRATGAVTLTGSNTITTLGKFSALGQTFSLLDGLSALTVDGPLNAGAISLSASSISIPGAITGTASVDLVATTAAGGGISETGSIATPLLTGSSADAVTLTGGNTITTVGKFSALGQTFSLLDGLSPLTVDGPLNADTISLSAPSIGIPGSITGTASVSVTATAGAIIETGSITTPLLTGNAGTSASFTGATPTTNQIDTLGKFDTTTSFELSDGKALAIVGAVTAGAGQTIALRADNLTIGAAVSAPGGTVAIAPATPTRGMSLDVANNPATLSLLQTDLNNIATGTLALGSVDGGTTLLTSALDIATPINLAGIAGTLGLFAGGPITEAGGLTVATLTGRATGAVTLTGSNTITTLGKFSALGQTFSLLDGLSPLTVDGPLDAAAISLSAPSISIPGAITGTASVDLAATGGGIGETGSVTTPLLTGSSAGTVTLTGSNTIATLGKFSALGQTFSLLDGLSALTVDGPLNAAAINLSAPSISIPGAITGTASVDLVATGGGIGETGSIATPLLTGSSAGTVTLTGSNTIATLGKFTALGQKFSLLDGLSPLTVNGPLNADAISLSASSISIPGAITGTASVDLVATTAAGGGISETGSIATPLLTGSSADAVTLTGSNTIAALGKFTALGQKFSLLDGLSALTVAGPLDAGVISLSAPSISIPGAITGTASVDLAATSGGISETGSVTTPLLTGSSAGTVTLTGSNTIATLGKFSALGQTFSLLDGLSALTVAGPLDAGTISLSAPSISIPGAITGTASVDLAATTAAGGGLSETGSIATPLLTGNSADAVTLTGSNTIATLGKFTALGQTFSLLDGLSALTVDGPLNAAAISLSAPSISIPGAITGTASVDLAATTAAGGGISETGSIATPLLTGNSADAVTLTGSNTIATLGKFSALGQTFSLLDGLSALTVAGPLDAGTISLSAPSISIPGAITGAASVDLVATTAAGGGISETGSLTTPLLTGSSADAVTLTGANTIATLGKFSALGQTFSLLDGLSPLTVDGPLNAAAISLSAPSISIPGAITGTASVDLVATTAAGGGIGETGSLTTPLLTGSSADAVTLTGSNTIATLGKFSALGQTFSLLDGLSPLTVDGPLNAAAISLSAPSISIPGAITGTASVDLAATGGGIGETGSLTTPLLTGSSAGTVTLTGSNTIATLGKFSALGQTFSLLDGLSALTVDGPLNAAAISLSAPSISIPGAITGTASVDLAATGGGIGETGSLTTPLLTGSSAGAVTLTGANTIATLGKFSAVGQTFSLLDGLSPLTVAGPLNAAAISLSAPSISIPGAITGTASVDLVATSGGISETGSVTTPLLTGSSAGTVTLTGSNKIAALGANAASPFSAAGQNFKLLDAGVPLLTVNGVTATTIDLTAPTMSIPGAITGTGSVKLVTTAGGISETGSVTTPLLTGSAAGTVDLLGSNNIGALGASGATPFSAVGQSFNLLDAGAPLLTVNGVGAAAIALTAPSINIPGAITGTTSVNLVASSGGIGETGTITTPLLTGSSVGTVALGGANKIVALGASAASPFSAIGQSFTLADLGTPLLTVNGLRAAVISLAAPNISIPGAMTGTSSINLVAATGGITETGSIISPLLTGSSAGAVGFTGANTIATLGSFSAAGQSFILLDAGAASLTVGALNAGAVSLVAPVISIPGSLSGTTSVNLVATAGGIGETGSVATPLLTGGAAGTVDLLGGNAIVALGPFNAPGQSFSLLDGGVAQLSVNDLLAATVSLTVPSIAIPGTLTGTTKVTLVATDGGINEPGTVTSPLLTGSATGDAKFTGLTNKVTQLDTFTAANFSLSDAAALTQTGALTATSPTGVVRLTSTATGASITLSGTTQAQTIVVDGADNKITLSDKASLITGGTARPVTLTAAAELPGATAATEVHGAFLTTSAGFIQTGASTVSAIGSGPSVLRINATGSANITFDPIAGLQGRASTWLILSIDTGTASGQVNVQNLDVVRGGGLTGSTDLSGSIGGVSGSAAAGSAGIQPGPNSNFRFNTCPIRSVNCVLLPTQGIPVANPLNDIYFGSLFNPDDDDDLLLPIVSDRDY